jgi:hypothetical protein
MRLDGIPAVAEAALYPRSDWTTRCDTFSIRYSAVPPNSSQPALLHDERDALRITAGSSPVNKMLPVSNASGRSIERRLSLLKRQDGRFFADRTAVRQHTESILLQLVVIEKAERLVEQQPFIELQVP